MKFILTIITFALFSTSAISDPAKLVQDKGCNTCHGKLDHVVITPRFIDINYWYKDDTSKIDYLSSKIINGSSGVWTATHVMPPNKNVSKEDADRISNWIIRLKR